MFSTFCCGIASTTASRPWKQLTCKISSGIWRGFFFYKCSKTNPDPDIPIQSSASTLQRRQKVIPPVKADSEMVPGYFQSCIFAARSPWLHISESLKHRCVLNSASLRWPKGAGNILGFSEADHRNSRKNCKQSLENAAVQVKQTQQKEIKGVICSDQADQSSLMKDEIRIMAGFMV